LGLLVVCFDDVYPRLKRSYMAALVVRLSSTVS
jgi:hypothetical protein